MIEKHKDETAQYGCGVIDAFVSGLAKEVGENPFMGRWILYMVGDATKEHRLAFARIPFDPKKPILLVVPKLCEIIVCENLEVKTLE